MNGNEKFDPNKQTSSYIPLEKIGVHGQYNQYGLAKRVAAALDDNPEINNIYTLCITQIGSTIILKGKIPNNSLLKKVVDTATRVHGVSAVDHHKVEIESSL